MKLTAKINIKGSVTALTGLHIGGSNSAMSIGGPDKMVIRNPLDNKPFIPGSSLKGKMRSLLEQLDKKFGPSMSSDIQHGPSNTPDSRAAKLFGSTGNALQVPSRVIVRDGMLLTPPERFTNTDLPYTESKTEVVIDRITSKAMPRQFERVPAGAEFGLNITVNIYDGDMKEKEAVCLVLDCLQLVADDYLGGSGTRGSGQVAFKIDSITRKSADYYTGSADQESILAQYEDRLNKLHASA